MAFKQVISACFRTNCSKLVISDITGVYHAVNNPKGWQNAATLLAANVDSAEILVEYIDENGTTTTVSTTDVTSQIPDPVTGTFEFNALSDTFEDGYYKITSTITDSSGNIYRAYYKVFNTCNVRCCIDKLKASLPEKMCGCDYEDFLKDIFTAEIILTGLESSAGCGNTSHAYTLLNKLEKICNWSDCNCN